MMTEPVTFRHSVAGFKVDLPREWEQAEGPAPGTSLVALEPESGRFRANVVVNVDELPEGLGFAGWQDGIDRKLPELMDGYLLLDREHVEINERGTIRRLAHHATPNGSATMEQWTMVDGLGTTGFSLTASAGTLDYDNYAPLFAQIAETFRL